MQQPPYGEEVIGVRKLGGVWRICWGMLDYRDGEIDWTPVADCSIARRIELLDQVGPLQEKIVESNQQFIGKIQNAVEKSKSIAEDLLDAKAKKKYSQSRASLEGN